MSGANPLPNSPLSPPILTAQHIDEIKQRIKAAALPSWFGHICQLLQSSDYMLAELMYHLTPPIWTPTAPPQQPPNYDPAAPLDLGPLLYLIEDPLPSSILNEIHQPWRTIISTVWWMLGELFRVNGVTTQIEATDFKQLCVLVEQTGVIGNDGTCYGLKPYQQLDDKWLWAAANFAVYWLSDYLLDKLPSWVADIWPWHPAKFVAGSPTPIALAGSSSQVKIAMMGDWGTGENDAAGEILQQIKALNPDYIIHLGDVYYSGTSSLDVLHAGEESRNLLEMLHSAGIPAQKCFTLNSNHEMCGGAKGYYAALQDPLFGLQQKLSYFALQYAGWTILGLDSAYFAAHDKMFMVGSIGDAPSVQSEWLNGITKLPNFSLDKSIVLTHHNALGHGWDGLPISTDIGPLWSQVGAALNGSPAYWYWGHVHNGIKYTQKATGSTLARCVGHGAIPFGNASNLAALMPEYIDYYSHTPVAPGSNLALNGFVVLTISQNGSLQEDFYELGNTTPVSVGPTLIR